MRKLFEDFLKREGAWEKYKAEFNRQNLPEATIKKMMERNRPYCYLGASFLWSKSIEGFLFWDVTERDWRKYIEDRNDK